MGLFKRKKKEEKPKIPEFPKLPEEPSFPTYEPQLKKFSLQKDEELPELEIPIKKPKIPERVTLPAEEKPLFVKIEKYKSAVDIVNKIKNKLSEAEKILENLNKIKNQEDEELEKWQTDIDSIKENLLKVDKELFEV